jgi:hypothetical protein
MTITRQIILPLTLSSRAAWLLGLSICSISGCSSSIEEGNAPSGDSGSSNGGASSGNTSSAGKTSAAGSAGTRAAGGGTAADGGSSTGKPELLGTFKIEVTADETGPTTGTTSVLGKVSSGATPLVAAWEDAATEGSCRLEKPRYPLCTPACGSAVCVEDDVCQAYPEAQNVGAVTLTGVQVTGGGASLALKETAKAYQPPPGTAFAYPPFAEGDAVALSAAGGDLPAFEVETTAVAPLWLTSEDLMLEEGKALELTWDGAADSKASSIHVKLDISHHGGSKGMIECDQADTGSLSIPAALVTELLGLGVAGFPTVKVTRAASANAKVGSGEVALVVASATERSVTIAGLESCTADDQCATGETCQSDLTCQ